MKPDLILHDGTVVTMDDKNNVFEAIAVKNGRIAAVGSNEEILKLGSTDTKMVNLDGKTVLPGFIDAHQHMFSFGFNLLYVDCRTSSIEEMVSAIKERAKASRPDDWIIGRGYSESYFKEKRKPTKWDFDGIDHPIFITRYCCHEAVVNEKALNIAGIRNNSIVVNGIIEKNDQGETTGVLVENAKGLVEKVMPTYTKQQMKEAIKLANEHYVKDGITSVHEAGLGFFTNAFEEFDVLQEMSEEGTLDVRMYLMILGESFDEFIKERASMEWNEKLTLGPLKLFTDGTLGGKTAAVTKDFKGSPGEKGMLLYSFKELEKLVANAHKQDKQVSIHAIGDRAINLVLDVYEKVQSDYPRVDNRHRIEHSTVTNHKILARMRQLGVIPVPQPALVHIMGDMYAETLDVPEANNVFANKNFIDYDLKPAGSSDCPVIPSSPLLGISSAMSRKTISNNVLAPEQRLTLYEALSMYTINAARASFEEDIKGTLEVGKLADMTILPSGFLKFSAQEIKDAEVEMTMIEGEIVFNKALCEARVVQ